MCMLDFIRNQVRLSEVLCSRPMFQMAHISSSIINGRVVCSSHELVNGEKNDGGTIN